jgi:hypothetical protein
MFLDPFDKPGVYLTSVWEDEDLFELEIHASNGRFTGKARCYTTRDQIAQLAHSVDRFPQATSDTFGFSTHAGENSSYFSLDFRCINGLGYVVARVKVAEIIHISNASGTDDIVEFDLNVEPASIDIFAAALAALAQAEIGQKLVTLHAKT